MTCISVNKGIVDENLVKEYPSSSMPIFISTINFDKSFQERASKVGVPIHINVTTFLSQNRMCDFYRERVPIPYVA